MNRSHRRRRSRMTVTVAASHQAAVLHLRTLLQTQKEGALARLHTQRNKVIKKSDDGGRTHTLTLTLPQTYPIQYFIQYNL